MNHRTERIARIGHALLLGAALALAAPAGAKDVYRSYLDPGLPQHRAILDTLERLKASPDDAGLHNDLGCLIAWDGFWKDALGEFDTAAKLDKKDARPLFNAGLVEASRGSWAAAKRKFSAATRRDAGNWPAWWMLGFSRESLGDNDGAVDAYKTSLRVDTSLFEVAKNPYAAHTKLRARVLLETYRTRMVRTGLPSREEFAAPERVSAFFQRSAAAAPNAPAAAAAEVEPAPAATGPIVTSAPTSSPSAPSSRPGPPARAPRVAPPPRAQDPNAEQAAPPDNLPFQNVTPAPKKGPAKKPPVMGPGGAPDEE